MGLFLFTISLLGGIIWLVVSRLEEEQQQRDKEEAIRKKEKSDFENAKNELLVKIEKWEKDGLLAISVKDKVLNQYNDLYFLGENFYLSSPKSNDLIKGTLMFVNKEVCFLSDTIVKSTPYSQILKVDIGPCEIRFTSKKYQYPLSFIRVTDNQYADRLEVCEAYARYHLRNDIESKYFIEDIKNVLNLPFPNFQKVVINKTE